MLATVVYCTLPGLKCYERNTLWLRWCHAQLLLPTWYHCAGVKIKYGDLKLHFISLFMEEFTAAIDVEWYISKSGWLETYSFTGAIGLISFDCVSTTNPKGINVLRESAGEGKVSLFECFALTRRKYFNKDIAHCPTSITLTTNKIQILKIL